MLTFTSSGQRVPMLSAAYLEDRTRPALDGSAASRLRYFRWPTWAAVASQQPVHELQPTQARMGRR